MQSKTYKQNNISIHKHVTYLWNSFASTRKPCKLMPVILTCRPKFNTCSWKDVDKIQHNVKACQEGRKHMLYVKVKQRSEAGEWCEWSVIFHIKYRRTLILYLWFTERGEVVIFTCHKRFEDLL